MAETADDASTGLAPSLAEALDAVYRDVTGSKNKRIALWNAVHAALAAGEKAVPLELASLLVNEVFRTLHVYQSRGETLAVERTLALGTRVSPQLLARVVRRLQTAAGIPTSSSSSLAPLVAFSTASASRGYYRLLRWTCLVIEASQDILWSGTDAGTAVWKACVSLICVLLGSLVGDASRPDTARAAVRVACSMLRDVPAAAQSFVNALSSASAHASHPIVYAILMQHIGPDRLSDAQRCKFLAVFIDQCLGARVAPARGVVELWSPLMHTLTHEELCDKLMPTIISQLKRSPEAILPSLITLLSALRLDLSRYARPVSDAKAAEAFLLIEEQVRSGGARDKINSAAVAGIGAMAKQVSDASALTELRDYLVASLNGKHGSLSHWTKRAGIAAAIGALAAADAVIGDALVQLAESTVAQLDKAIGQEASDDVRVALLDVVTTWQVRGRILAATSVKLYNLGIPSEKERVRHAYLASLAASLDKADEPTLALELIEPLASLVCKARTKVVLRPDALLALRCVLVLVQRDATAIQRVEKTKLVAEAMQPDSVLHSPAFLDADSTPPAALQAYAQLAGTILSVRTDAVVSSALVDRVCDLLASLLTHPLPKVSRAAASVAASAASSAADVAHRLINRLWERVCALTAASPSQRQVLARAVAAVAGTSVTILGEDVPALLLLSSHPFVSRGNTLWPRILAAHQPGDLTPHLKLDSLDGLLDVAVSDLPGNRVAAQRAVTVLARSLGFPTVAEAVLQATRVPVDLQDASDHDLAVYRARDGEFVASGDPGAYVPKVVVNKGRRTEDEEWEEQLKRDLAKKKGEKILDPEEIKRQEELAKQAARRAVLTSAMDRLRRRVDVLTHLLMHEAAAMHSIVPKVLAQLSHLACHAFATMVTEDAVTAVVSCCVASDAAALCRVHPRRVAHTWLAIVSHRRHNPSLREDWLASIVPDIVASTLTVPCAMSGPSLALFLPLFRRAVDINAAQTPSASGKPGAPAPAKPASSLSEDVLSVLERHASLPTSADAVFPLPELIDVLLHIAHHFLRHCQRVSALLTSLALQIKPGDSTAVAALTVGLLAGQTHVRRVAMLALRQASQLTAASHGADDTLLTRVFLAMSDDSVPELASLASETWQRLGYSVPATYASLLMPLLSHPESVTRTAAGKALARAAAEYSASVTATFALLFSAYTAAQRDVAREIDDAATRQAVADALHAFSAALPSLASTDVDAIFAFLASAGLLDPDDVVRKAMIRAGSELVTVHGKEHLATLLPLFERQLSKPCHNQNDDLVRQGMVVFMGSLARHLGPEDNAVHRVVQMLLEALATPSESVQRSVAQCLPPLVAMPAVKENAAATVSLLLDQLTDTSVSYAQRRGAAYGLAGIVKGLGISALKAHGIMDKLKDAAEQRQSALAREGALFAFETLCGMLGRLFEPYIIHILPLLLACFGDNDNGVRMATADASRAIMGNLSGHGVKLVLPAVLKALDSEQQWRSKKGSIELLGAMAHLAPRQLSTSLPKIVPSLIQVLMDPHPKIQAAGTEALDSIASVIRNPEILEHRKVILGALSEPDRRTGQALDVLLNTAFVHRIDAPSLALIMPILSKGLGNRLTDIKMRAASIVGNMCSLADPKDVVPYLPLLLPDLRAVLVDPIPEARGVAARALGSLVRGIGEEHFETLVPWLLDTLKSEVSSVERSGAAQGLAEIVAGLGVDKLRNVLPTLLQNTMDPAPAIREGYLQVFVFVPTALGHAFQPFLPDVLPYLLRGLADEQETVRDISLKAGRVLVNQFADTSLSLLLPTLQDGLFHENWRIRESSVLLLGDLLYRLAGTSGNIQTTGGDDDESVSTEKHTRALAAALGERNRNYVLSALYMVRSDTSPVVRQASMHVWKSVVANTPKTLREILPTLMDTLIVCLGSEHNDRRLAAGRSLGNLVGKLGDQVLPIIVPILQAGVSDDDPAKREGVCLGLSEVLASASPQHLERYLPKLVPSVKQALCDEAEAVREAAADAFDAVFRAMGPRAVDDVMPGVTALLETEDPARRDNAIHGVRQLLRKRPAAVLRYLVPRIVAESPLSVAGSLVLSVIAQEAGDKIHHYLSVLLPPLTVAMAESDRVGVPPEREQAAKDVVAAVEQDALHLLISDLMPRVRDADATLRLGATKLLAEFCSITTTDYKSHVQRMMQSLFENMNDADKQIVQAAWNAMLALSKTLSKDEGAAMIPFLRDQLRQLSEPMRSAARRAQQNGASDVPPVQVAGFALPKGLAPVLPMFLHGLMFGSAAVREQAALGLGDLIDLTPVSALRPYVIQITGPLIRVIGDRFPAEVKAAILSTLCLLIDKAGIMLKPFVPQLQTTFVKALHEATRSVRARAATALGKLIALSTKIDPLVTELHTGVRSRDASEGVREAMLAALAGVLRTQGAKVSPTLLSSVGATLTDMLAHEDAGTRAAAAPTFAAYLAVLAEDAQVAAIKTTLLAPASAAASWADTHGRLLALACVLVELPTAVFASHAPAVRAAAEAAVKDEKIPVRLAGVKVAGAAITRDVSPDLLPALSGVLSDPTNDVRKAAVDAIKPFVKSRSVAQLRPLLPVLVPTLMKSVKDANVPVRLASERALLHTLRVYDPASDLLSTYAATQEALAAKQINDYARRVLGRLNIDSDAEEE